MSKEKIESIHRLSGLQQGILSDVLLNQGATNNGGANQGTTPYYHRYAVLVEGVDERALQDAWREAIERHTVLRTAFFWEGQSEPVQVVLRSVALPWMCEDFRALAPDAREAKFKELLDADEKRGFDLQRAPLARFYWVRWADEQSYFVWSSHHLIVDGWSVAVLFDEVTSIYLARTKGTALHLPKPRTFGEYLAWLRLRRSSDGSGAAFWRKQLSDLDEMGRLPGERMRRDLAAGEGYGEVLLRFSETLNTKLRAFATKQRLFASTVIQGAWAWLLAQHAGSPHVCYGMTYFGRPAELSGSEHMVGLFINSLPMHVHVDFEGPTVSWLQGIQDTQLTVAEHSHDNLVDVRAWAGRPGGAPLFESLLALRNEAKEDDRSLARLNVRSQRTYQTTNIPLTIHSVPGETVCLALTYDERRFSREGVIDVAKHLEQVVDSIIGCADAPVRKIGALSPGEWERLVREHNQTSVADPVETVDVLFRRMADERRDALAIIAGDHALSYEQLDALSDRIALALQENGVRPGDRVGIYHGRSAETVAALLGTLKAGAAYVPLDVEAPTLRLGRLIADARLRVLVTSRKHVSSLPSTDTPVLLLEDVLEGPSQRPRCMQVHSHADAPAYVMYTSGTTGKPKAVMVTHRGISRRMRGPNYLTVVPGERILHAGNLVFDATTFEIWSALLNGATLVVLPQDVILSPEALSAAIGRQAIDHMLLTVSLFNHLVAENADILSSVRTVFVGGEAADPHWIACAAQRCPDLRIVNAYGPTEATVLGTFHEVSARDLGRGPIPIGIPVTSTQCYVLDAHLNVLPAGIPGELFIGGEGVALGYFDAPALTAEAFVPDPFSPHPGARMYRTGDLTSWNSAGQLHFLGRRDRQVKLRGVRIEVAEVEATLRAHESVKHVVVEVVGENAESRKLVAYIVPKADASSHPDLEQLRTHASSYLPRTMLPAEYRLLQALPLNANGKLDHSALKRDSSSLDLSNRTTAAYSSTEAAVLSIWREVLGCEEISLDDSFYAVGGHSLAAIRVLSRLRHKFGTELSLKEIFARASIRLQAELLDARVGPVTTPDRITRVARDQPIPLSSTQEQLWFLQRSGQPARVYNIPAVLALRGPLDVGRLSEAVRSALGRHEVLRTTIGIMDGAPIQRLNAVAAPSLEVSSFVDLPLEQARERAQQAMVAEAHFEFSLEHGPLLRTRLLRIREDESLLTLVLHHVIADGWSLRILLQEISAAYGGQPQPQAATEPYTALQFADYSAWQRAWVESEACTESLSFWREHLEGAPPTLDLPNDFPRTRQPRYAGAQLPFACEPEVSARLSQLAQDVGCSLFGVLLSAYEVLLARYTGATDLVVGLPVANRHQLESEHIVGCFANTIGLRTKLSRNMTFVELALRVGAALRDAHAHSGVPFERVVSKLAKPTLTGRSPIFQVCFSFEPDREAPLRIDGIEVTDVSVTNGTSKFELSLGMNWSGEQLHGAFEYDANLFAADTVANLSEGFQVLLREVAEQPHRQWTELCVVSPTRAKQVAQALAGPSVALSENLTVTRLLEQAEERSARGLALSSEHALVSYAELRQRIHNIALQLKERGVSAEMRVGVHMAKGPEWAQLVLAIWRLGACYVPLDPTLPAGRLQIMAGRAGLHCVVLAPGAGAVTFPCTTYQFEEVLKREGSGQLPADSVSEEQLAYVIFTSGSTGRPKGVGLTFRGLWNLVAAQRHVFHIEPGDRVAQFASSSFDASVFELCLAIGAGATALFRDESTRLPGAPLATLLASGEVNALVVPPSALAVVPCAAYPSLRTLIVAGEPCPTALVENWAPGRAFFNAYGPTETTVWATYARCEADGPPPPIGRPILNTRAYVLNAELRPVPPGACGELYLGGPLIARGYLSDAGQTAAHFVPDPFSGEPSARLYKTGDMVRLMTDGQLLFIGRADDQVKVRGFRIELGEVEHVLTCAPGIAQAIVALQPRVTGNRLIAFVSLRQEAGNIEQRMRLVRQYLAEQLPAYMLPSEIVQVAEFPRLPSGKIDRSALIAYRAGPSSTAGPKLDSDSPLRLAIRNIWCQVLGRKEVTDHASFFELGGDSLTMARVHLRLTEELHLTLGLVDLFELPTIDSICRRVTSLAATEPARSAGIELRQDDDAIAVIGMAGRFPMSPDVDRFWDNIAAGVEAITSLDPDQVRQTVGPEAEQPNYVASRALLEDEDLFAASFFGVPTREAELMDPQHRIFLEIAHQALEHGGYDPFAAQGRVGVFAGASTNSYAYQLLRNPGVLQSIAAQAVGIHMNGFSLANRVSYKLNLTGPSLCVDTGCSTSMVAVHLACQSLLRGECEMALAGGVSVTVPQRQGYLYQLDGTLSADGRCRPFDATSTGTGVGNGAGVLLLKPLRAAQRDRDHVLAVIKASAVNNDGRDKMAFSAPSAQGQANVIRSALDRAGLSPDDIQYVETHGTGTILGDPIEISGLTKAFGASEQAASCAIGSVKGNIGHLDAAAAIGGLIKTIQALRHKQLPPSINFSRPNPNIDFSHSRFFVNTELREWSVGPGTRRAGVSSFGIGGTNGHLILEEATANLPAERGHSDIFPFLVSAKTAKELDVKLTELEAHIRAHPEQDLERIAFTLQQGRTLYPHRACFVARDREHLLATLHTQSASTMSRVEFHGKPRLTFLFPGGGTQYAAMTQELYERDRHYRAELDRCFSALLHLGLDLKPILFAGLSAADLPTEDQQMQRTGLAMPALFAVEYSLARWLMQRGLRPDSMIGHSLGEYVAACIAEVMELETALAVVVKRAQLCETLVAGQMLSVPLDPDTVQMLLPEECAVAAANGPRSCVISGPSGPIEMLNRTLTGRGLEVRTVPIRVASHSPAVEPILEEFAEFLRGVDLGPPKIPYISNVTGDWISSEQAMAPEYWTAHLRQTVRFGQGVRTLGQHGATTWIEVGPGRVLSSLLGENVETAATTCISTLPTRALAERGSERETLLSALCKAWAHGHPVDWNMFWDTPGPGRVPLPTYPFERKRYWVEPSTEFETLRSAQVRESPVGHNHGPAAVQAALAGTNSPPVAHDSSSALLQVFRNAFGNERIGENDNFFELGGDSLLAIHIATKARELGIELRARHIFEHQTVAALVETFLEAGTGRPEQTEKVPDPKDAPPADAGPTEDAQSRTLSAADFRRVRISQEQLESIYTLLNPS